MNVIKRDGTIVPYNEAKIQVAIKKAFIATGYEDVPCLKSVVSEISISVKNYPNEITVEAIQDIVEEVLMASGYLRVAKNYIIYREKHRAIREAKTELGDITEMVGKYIGLEDWKINENANMGYSLQGMNNYIATNVTSNYWLNEVYDNEIKNAHVSGDIHIHDLSTLGAYCCGWDLVQLLENGFGGVENKVSSLPAKHFRSALGQIVNFVYSLQGECSGAQAFSNFDTLLAPFIRYDKLDYKAVLQSMQEFIFNMNVSTRVGFQTPFSNITMDSHAPSYLAKLPVVIGGKYQTETYGDFQVEMNMLNRAFCEVMITGDANGRLFSFPIPTYNLTKIFDWENPEFEPLWKMTAKYGIPYFANFINSDMEPEDVRSMCCRLRLRANEINKRSGGLFAANPMTGAVGIVTLNLPRIGYLSRDEDDIYFRIDNLLGIARKSLKKKREVVESLTNQGLYPYCKVYLSDIAKANHGKYWHNHFNTIGILGMNELLKNFNGEDIVSISGSKLAQEIMEHILMRLGDFQEEDNQMYNLESTPAEGTTYRLALLDKKQFPDIKQAGFNEKYYTNSTNLPVDYTSDIFDAASHQDKFLHLYTGGSVFHGFLGECVTDTVALKELIRTMAETYKMPYFTITPTFSVCKNCGYIPGEWFVCQKCKEDTEVYSRVVGFYRPVSQWNIGKRSEYSERVPFFFEGGEPNNAYKN